MNKYVTVGLISCSFLVANSLAAQQPASTPQKTGKITKLVAKPITIQKKHYKKNKAVISVKEDSGFYIKDENKALDYEIVYDPVSKQPIGVKKKVSTNLIKSEVVSPKEVIQTVEKKEPMVIESKKVSIQKTPKINKPVDDIDKMINPVAEETSQKKNIAPLKNPGFDLLPTPPSEKISTPKAVTKAKIKEEKVIVLEEPKKEVTIEPEKIKPIANETPMIVQPIINSAPKIAEPVKVVQEGIKFNSKDEIYLVKENGTPAIKFKYKDKDIIVPLENEMSSFTGTILSGNYNDWEVKMYVFEKKSVTYNVFINSYNTTMTGSLEEKIENGSTRNFIL